MRVDQSAERMRVDGALREWKGARFVSLGSGDDAALRFALATTDGKGLFLAAEVADDRLVRRSGVGPRQDALVLSLVMPKGKDGLSAVELWLHPGEMGKSKAQAGIGAPGAAPRPSSDIEVIEGPRDSGAPGYVIEAYIPFRLVPGAEIWEQGRAALRFEDVDVESKPSVESVVSTHASQKPADMPRLALGMGQKDFLGSFLSAQGVTASEPRYDFRGQVAGDAAPERVVIVDRYVVVYGPRFKQGNAFSSFALPIGMGGGLKSAELTDLTADGIEELAVVLRQRNELGAREVWFALSFAGDTPQILYGIELRKEAKGGFIEASLDIDRKGRGAPIVRVKPGRSSGLSADNYRETRSADVQAILLPWEDVVARSYQFDGARFALLEETRDPKKAAAKPTQTPAPKSEPEPETMVPIEPTVDAVLTLFKEQRGLPKNAKPSRHLRANLLGSRAIEDLFVYGVQLVVIGPDLGGGGSYFAYGLPISDPSDLLHVGTDDVTGDGRAEIFVRVRQSLSGVEGVKRGVMLVHRFDEQARFSRVLSVEAFRYQGSSFIANTVSTARGVLVVGPGRAQGFSETNFPFIDEAVGGVGRLLLPWKDEPVRYRFQDGALVP